MKSEEFKKILEVYSKLDDSKKKEAHFAISEVWGEMAKEYARLCDEDAEYTSLFEEISEIHNVLSFDFDSVLSQFIYEGYEDDPDLVPEYFREKIYAEHKDIFENYELYVKEANEELELLKSKKFVINREGRIKKVEKELHYYKRAAWFYEYSQDMIKKQDLWSHLAATDKKIVMYGMGNGADKILNVCAERGIEIADFFASDGFVRGHSFHGKVVLSYSDTKEKYGAEKMIYSSGYPFYQEGCGMLQLKHSGLSDADIEKIAGKNLENLLKGAQL